MMTKPDATEARDVTCFVIGPIGDKDADADSAERKAYEEAIQVFEEVIEPACRGYGISVVRADKIAMSGEITDQVFRLLRDAYLVVADLTGANPNVMYELGLRHTTGKLTIQIGERERLPFDISIIRTILFRRTEAGLVEARRRLAAAIAVGLEKGGDPVSATRVWFETGVDLVSEANVLGDDKTATSDEPGFLEKVTEMFEGLNSALMSLGAIPEVIDQIKERVSNATARIDKANETNAPPSAKLYIANHLAQDLEEPASRLAVLAGDYRQSVERMDAGVRYALSSIRQQTIPDPDAKAFEENVSAMIGAAEGTFPTIEYFRAAVLSTGEATRSLRRVNGTIAASLSQILGTRRIFDEWRKSL